MFKHEYSSKIIIAENAIFYNASRFLYDADWPEIVLLSLSISVKIVDKNRNPKFEQ